MILDIVQFLGIVAALVMYIGERTAKEKAEQSRDEALQNYNAIMEEYIILVRKERS